MTVNDVTVRGQTDTVSFEFDLKHGAEKVWRALTEPALLAQWLLPVFDLEWKKGSAFTFRRDPLPGWDGIVHCRVLESEPPHKLSYTWLVGDMDTVVTFTLTPTPTGTRLSLVQSGFREDQKKNWGGARYGWNLMGGKLLDVLETLP